ncbi:Arv1-domain-containing protein [Leucogyrophana mollusca]|uniref:Arv1-domain-containing protein n=1 Tax=Leucogyrophana mollusca TaxID=85980 RepID=A0ACB8BQC7_9AGAM|nr:Arv1-domain-containing protein [Leucogyrophana mollusca]
MPICTTCTHPIAHLYTVYESAYNLRLEQCSNCQAFADPYVEHDSLTLLLDLILLKRSVYRHLLYNRGTEPSRAHNLSKNQNTDHQLHKPALRDKEHLREKARWWLILQLGGGLLAVDAFIRWAHLNPLMSSSISLWTAETNIAFLRIMIGCFIEMVAFHGGVVFASFFVMMLSDWIRSWGSSSPPVASGVRQEFRYSLIPLTIFYSSLTKLFLLFLLSIWRPSSSVTKASTSSTTPYYWDTSYYDNPFIASALEIWDEDKLDREWVVRNVLGGMAAGFGLRVVLDCHPIYTTIVILVGWVVKTAVAGLLKDWVGGDEHSGEVWLAYSIP